MVQKIHIWSRLLPGWLFASAAMAMSALGAQSVNLEWNASPSTGVTGYQVKYGTTSGSYTRSMNVGAVTTATVPNLTEGNTYYFAVSAVDSTSLESVPSNEVSYDVVAPNQAPTITLTSNGSSVTAPANITLSASASDSDGTIALVEFYSDSTKVGESTASPFNYSVALNSVGTYSFTARAYDDKGAFTDSVPVSVTVNAPAVVQGSAISTVSYVSGSGTTLTVKGTPGVTQSVYVSSDLKTWSLLSSATNDTGTLTVNDPAAANLSQRFYRVTDSTTTSTPSGFTKLQIAGISGKQTAVDSYLGINLVNPVSYQGTVSSDTANTIIDASSTWSDDQFNGSNGAYYLEIISGEYAGATTDIVATNAASKSLQTDEDFSTVLTGGEKYAIRKHRTIGDIFGASNSAKLKSSNAVTTSDEVRLFNPLTQAFLSYYYNSSLGGWRSSTDADTEASNTELYLDQGVMLRRKAAGALTVVVTGEVKYGQTLVPIGSKSNLCANMYPAGTLTLGNSGLYNGSSTTGLVGSSKLSSADEVQIWTGSTFRRYFYKSGGAGGIGWRLSGSSADASGTQIPIGSSIYVIRKSGRPAFNWKVAQPF